MTEGNQTVTILLEQFNHMCDELLELREYKKNSINMIDKIKAEILDEAEYAYADFNQYKEDILHAESDELPDDDFRYGMERAVEIINKYKEESDKESE